MGILVTRAVWKHSAAKGNQLLVLLALADRVFDQRIEEEGAIAWPSQSTLSKQCNCARSTVEEALKGLAEDGEILDTGQRASGKYRGTVMWEVLPGVNFSDLTENRSDDRNPVMTDLPADLTDLPADLTDSRRDLTDRPVTRQKEDSKERQNRHRSPSPSAPVDARAGGEKRVAGSNHAPPAQAVLAIFNEHTGADYSGKRWLAMIGKRIAENPTLALDDHRAIVEQAVVDPWWDDERPKPYVIYSAAEFEGAREAARDDRGWGS